MTTYNEYTIGQVVRFSASFTDENGVPADPTSVTVSIKHEAGTATDYIYGTDPEVKKDSVGNYHIDIEVTEKGSLHDRWVGTGSIVAAAESRIYGQKSEFV